jgi:hypothetical protein
MEKPMRAWKTVFSFLVSSVALGGIGLSTAHAKKDVPAIRVSLTIPQLCDGADGKPALPRFLPLRYATERFPVVIENISDKPVQIFAEGNSMGDEILSFEITGPDGKTTVMRPIGKEYFKNIFRTERLLPGEKAVRDVNYNANPPQWEGFPSPATGKPYKATMRAILTQAAIPNNKNTELWAGKVASPALEIKFGQ